jgi:hypothetical protein
MKLTKSLLTLMLMSALFFVGCGPKDADIKTAVEEKLKSNTEMGSMASVSVNKGVVTLSGECKDQACHAQCESLAKSAKGVKSVVSNMTIAAAMTQTAPVEIATESALTQGVNDATKDFPGVQANVSADGVITLTGDIKRSDLTTLMQSLNTLKPKKIENQLTIK